MTDFWGDIGMRQRLIWISCCAIAVSLSAQAKAPVPTATLNLKKGYDKGAGLATGTAQFYDYAPDNRCIGRKRLYKFSAITKGQASKPVPAGQKVVISAYTNRYNSTLDVSAPSGVGVSTATCENRVEFTPVAGESYDVLQPVEVGKRCTMKVIVASSGLPPADLQLLDPATCTAKK